MDQDGLSVIGRRYEMCAYILISKSTTYKELMRRFDVCRATVYEDLNFIEEYLFVPLERINGRYGGIFFKGEVKRFCQFNLDEVLTMINILADIPGEKKDMMESIIARHIDTRKLPEEVLKQMHFYRE